MLHASLYVFKWPAQISSITSAQLAIGLWAYARVDISGCMRSAMSLGFLVNALRCVMF